MDTGPFNKLHNAGNEHIGAVTNGINFHFLTLDILVNQNRLIFVDFNRCFQIMAQLFFIGNDLHSTAAKNKAGTHQYGIADFCSGCDTVLDLGNCSALRLRNIQFLQDLFKAVTVFSALNCGTICSDDLHATIHQGLCQIDSGLPAQRCDNALGFLKLNDVHNIFRR